MTKVSVIIVTYNSADFIEKCILSVLNNLPKDSEIVVLDNASSDQTINILEEFVPEIKLIRMEENLGFGKGNNQAIKKASGEYLFLLNPDTEMQQPILDELINFYKNTDNVGIVAPKLIKADDKIQSTVKKLPTIWGAFKEFILGIKNSYSQYVPSTTKPTEVEVVYGAAMLISKKLFDKLNGFNERYFIYYEDIDLCKRVKDLGKKIYYCPQVSIKHLVGATKSDQDRYQQTLRSAQIYHGKFKAFILQLIFFIPRLRRRLNLG